MEQPKQLNNTIFIFGKRTSGKSTLVKSLLEHELKNYAPVFIINPTKAPIKKSSLKV